MNLNEYAALKGIVLTKPQANLLAKLSDKYLVGINAGEPDVCVAYNQVTGAPCSVNPLVYVLHRFVTRTYASYGYTGTMNYNGKPVAIGIFDRVRYLILALDKKAYAELID